MPQFPANITMSEEPAILNIGSPEHSYLGAIIPSLRVLFDVRKFLSKHVSCWSINLSLINEFK